MQGRCRIFTYRALTVYGRPSQATSANHNTFSLPSGQVEPDTTLPQPRTHNPYPVSHAYGLASSAFARHYSRNHILFSSPTGTEMFHFPALPPHRLYIHRRVTRHHSRRISPFGHPRIHARLTAPRGISQPPTSFIGSRCQGIHHAPLNTYKHKNQETKIAKQTKPTTEPCLLDARNHYPQNKHHTPPPRWSDNTPTPTKGATTGLLPQDPTVCPTHKGRPPETITLPAVGDQSCCCS